MPRDERFSPQEWTAVVALPFDVAEAVFAVASHHPAALAREFEASDDELHHPGERGAAAGLIAAIEAETDDERDRRRIEREVATPETMRARGLEAVRAAAPLLGRLEPEEAAALRRWLVDVGEAVAAAAREGHDPDAVSPRERETLREVEAALGGG